MLHSPLSFFSVTGNGGDAAALGMLRKPRASEEGHTAASHFQLSGLQRQQTARLGEGPFISLSLFLCIRNFFNTSQLRILCLLWMNYRFHSFGVHIFISSLTIIYSRDPLRPPALSFFPASFSVKVPVHFCVIVASCSTFSDHAVAVNVVLPCLLAYLSACLSVCLSYCLSLSLSRLLSYCLITQTTR